MDYAVGMCYTPRRNDTIGDTVNSIRQWYTDPIIVAAEPCDTVKLRGKMLDVRMDNNQYGCFKNHDRLLNLLVQTNKPYILLLQDDFVYHKDMGQKIEEIIGLTEQQKANGGGRFGYYNFYTNEVYKNKIHKEGWNSLRLGFDTGYQVSYLMDREVVIGMMNHKFYLNHLYNYEKNQQVDACITETLRQMGLPMYCHNPSLAIHIGAENSTLGHKHKHDETFNSFRIGR